VTTPPLAAGQTQHGWLADEERAAIREAVTEAVLGTPQGLREALARDPEASLRLVEASRTAAEETSRLLTEAVANARSAGHSWDVIGRLIGVSRQAVQQRFGSASPAPPGAVPPEPGAPARKVLSPLTAFTEMPVLEAEGRRGWHVVDYGTLHHVVEASDHQWEHRRAMWAPGVARRLIADGWTLVNTMTFPWGYYKRRLDLPAEPTP
jgi:hypothetical protein